MAYFTKNSWELGKTVFSPDITPSNFKVYKMKNYETPCK